MSHSDQPKITLRTAKFQNQSDTKTITQVFYILFYLFSYLLNQRLREMLSFKYGNSYD